MIKNKVKVLMTCMGFIASCYGQPTLTDKMKVGNLGKDILLNTLNISDKGMILIANENGGINTYYLDKTLSKNKNYLTKGSFIGKPMVHNSSLLVADENNVVCYAIEGRVKWTRSFSDRVKAEIRVVKDKVYIQVRGEGIYCLDESNGSTLWLKSSKSGTIGGLIANEKMVLVSGLGDSLLCLNATNGDVLWNKEFIGSVLSDISYDTKILAVNTCELVGEKSSTKILALDSGHIISEVSLQANCRYKPLVKESLIYIGTEDSKIIAFDYMKGQKIWECVLPDNDVVATDFLLKDELIYFGSIDRRLYKVNLISGKVITNQQYEYGLSNLIMWNDNIYFAIGNGDLIKCE